MPAFLIDLVGAMQLFVGLGNPGPKHAGNRHNIGFMAIDALAREHRAPPFRARFQGLVSEAAVAGDRVILLKPTTYMNESGRAAGEAMRFYKIALADVVVFHDELDLPPAKVRVKTGGGSAGHNGLRSLSQYIGNDYRRVRLGIGHPGDKDLVHAYVLNDFGKAETPWVETVCDCVGRFADMLLKRDDPGFQNKVHLAMEAAGFGGVKRMGEA